MNTENHQKAMERAQDIIKDREERFYRACLEVVIEEI